MQYIFFISDICLWALLIGLFVWLILLSDKITKIDIQMTKLLKYLETGNISSEHNVSPNIQNVEVQASNHKKEELAPEPMVAPAITPETKPQTSTAQKVKKKQDIETVFLGNIFNKIGAFALIIAFIFFIKLVSPFIVLTDLMKVLLGYFVGTGIFFTGLYLHKSDKMKNFSEVLIGTGFATFFITSYCACYMKVFNPIAGIITGCLLLLLVFFTSHKMKSVSSLIIGLIGGYMTPAFSGVNSDISLAYLIFLNIVSIIYAFNNPKYKWVNILNLIITIPIMFINCITAETSKIVYAVALWGIYLIYDLIRDKLCKTDNVTSVLNYICLTLVSLTLFSNSAKAVGIMFGITALLYAIIAFVNKNIQNPIYKMYEHYIFLDVWFSVLFTLNDLYSIITWSVVGLILSFAVKRGKLNTVKHYISIYYLSAVFGTLLAKDGSSLILFQNVTPVLNMRTVIFLVPVLAMTLSVCRLKNKEYAISNFLRFCTIFLFFCYVITEITCYTKTVTESYYALNCIYTGIGFMFSVILTSMGIKNKFVGFNVLGILFGTVSTIMLISTLWDFPTYWLPVFNIRTLAFLAALYFCYYCVKVTNSAFYKYLAIFIGFIFCGAEASVIDISLQTGYLTSLGLFLYAAVVTLLGIVKSGKTLVNSGIWMISLSVLRIFIFDLANVESVYKIIAFLILGSVLMAVSYVYIKRKSN